MSGSVCWGVVTDVAVSGLIHLELAEYSSRESIQCAQCGKRHREIFKLQRMYNRKGTEFENVVKPMIEKWNRLVQLLE